MELKILNSSEYIVSELDDTSRQRFDAFLDRNYPTWREQVGSPKERSGIHRRWHLGIDDVERNAIYRGDFVEIYDEFFEKEKDGEVLIHTPKHQICAIDGDTTPVAVWGQRNV